MKRIRGLGFWWIACIAGVGLSGCSTMGAPPRCPHGNGIACARVDQINRLVDRGQLGAVSSGGVLSSSVSLAHTTNVPRINSTAPARWHNEQVMKIWLAPFEDTEGNYHQASVIHTVVKAGYWSNHPPRAVTSDSS